MSIDRLPADVRTQVIVVGRQDDGLIRPLGVILEAPVPDEPDAARRFGANGVRSLIRQRFLRICIERIECGDESAGRDAER